MTVTKTAGAGHLGGGGHDLAPEGLAENSSRVSRGTEDSTQIGGQGGHAVVLGDEAAGIVENEIALRPRGAHSGQGVRGGVALVDVVNGLHDCKVAVSFGRFG